MQQTKSSKQKNELSKQSFRDILRKAREGVVLSEFAWGYAKCVYDMDLISIAELDEIRDAVKKAVVVEEFKKKYKKSKTLEDADKIIGKMTIEEMEAFIRDHEKAEAWTGLDMRQEFYIGAMKMEIAKRKRKAKA